MTNEIDAKLHQCQRALSELDALKLRQDKSSFEYHFCAYIGFFGAVRQYVQVRLRLQIRIATLTCEQAWLEVLETNLDVATVVGLRNSDVHSSSIQATNQCIRINIDETLAQISDSVATIVSHAKGTSEQTSPSVDEPPMETPRPSQSSTEFAYLLDPAKLAPDFMTADRDHVHGRIPDQQVRVKPGDPLPLKLSVAQHLCNFDLGDIAVRSYAELTNSISKGRSLGFNL